MIHISAVTVMVSAGKRKAISAAGALVLALDKLQSWAYTTSALFHGIVNAVAFIDE